jgi:glucose/arabinose dehydrogenase
MRATRSVGVVLAMLLAAIAVAGAQQQPRAGMAIPPLGPPVGIRPHEQHKIRVSVVAKGLSHPWAIAFLPDGRLLISERAGRLRIVRNGVLDPKVIAGTPVVRTDGNGGLMDVALLPRFAENHFVYLTYTKAVEDTKARRRSRADGSRRRARGRSGSLIALPAFEGTAAERARRVRTRRQGLHVDRRQHRHDLAGTPSLRGKILRLNDDGTVPPAIRSPAGGFVPRSTRSATAARSG